MILGTFRSEDEDEFQYGFSLLSMRIRFGVQKTHIRSRPRPPI